MERLRTLPNLFLCLLVGWLGLAAGLGCGAARLEPVRIDLSQANFQSALPSAPARKTSLSQPKSLPAASQTIVGDPPMLADQNASRDVTAIGKAIKEELNQTNKDVFLRFRSILLRRLNDKKFEDQQKLDTQQKADQEKATEQISTLYRAYAAKRFPLLVHLSSLVGFPDPDPRSQREPGNSLSVQDRYHTTIVQLRQQIRAMDQDFKAQMATILDHLTANNAALQNQLNAAYLNDLNNLDTLAKAEAAKVTGRSEAEIKPLLVNQDQAIIPGVAASTLSLPAAPAIVPQNLPHPTGAIQVMNRAAIEASLNTWLRLNGYRLSKDSRDPDKTKQFVQWLKTFQPVTSNTPLPK